MLLQTRLVIAIHFTITDAQGLLLESTTDSQPFCYLQNAGCLPAAVEAAIDLRNTGELFELLLSPEQAYGYIDNTLIKELLMSDIAINNKPLQIGDCIDVGINDGHTWIVCGIQDNKVHVNANHPWAGKAIHMKIKIISRRPAFDAEINKGMALLEEMLPAACGPNCCC